MKVNKGCFILVGLFPYLTAMIFPLTFLEPFQWIIYKIFDGKMINVLTIDMLILLIGTILSLVYAFSRKEYSAKTGAKYFMVMKLVQVPAYIITFLLGLLLLITIFTAGISLLFLVLNALSIVPSFIIGARVVRDCQKEGLLSTGARVTFTILQAVFCLDVISSVIVFCMVRKRSISVK